MKYLIFAILFISTELYCQNSCPCAEINISNGQDITVDLNFLLDFPDAVICFNKEGGTDGWDAFHNVIYNDPNAPGFTLSDNQQLRIPNGMRFNTNGTITLEDNASIIGENNGASRINQLEEGEVFIVISNGTENTIRDIQIEAVLIEPPLPGETNARRTPIEDVIGIELDESSENTTVQSVRFNGLLTGMIVESNNNTFLDLHFFDVGTSNTCEVDPMNREERGAAVFLSGNENEFINVFHNRSEGAVSIWWLDNASQNDIINLSVEQEDGQVPCANGDPAVFLDASFDGSDNVCVENFNGARYSTPAGTQLASTCQYCLNNSSAFLNEITFPNLGDPCSNSPANCNGGMRNETNSCR